MNRYHLRASVPALCLLIYAVPVIGAEGAVASRAIEEVIVTAQRTAESIQDVPIAVTALTGDMLEERGVLTSSDLQMNAPSVTFTPTNFGDYSFSIRGIGNLVIGGESGVSTHINEIPVASQLQAVEFYDMERVEILRGPQGTLFGRNATGGAVNFVTKRPDFDSVNGFIDLEMGDYDNRRLKGAVNFPVTDNFAIRVAGMMLERDGYIKNTAFGRVADNGVGAGIDTISGIKKDLDGRDIQTFRVTGEWQINDAASLWVMYTHFKEDDDRARITNQICRTNIVPTIGCLTDEVAFEAPHAYTGTGGIIFGLGAQAYNTFGPNVTQKYDVSEGDRGFRKMHTDFQPVYKEKEDIWAFGFEYEFDTLKVGLTGAYQERDFVYQQDYLMDTGNLLFDGSINFPVSAPAGKAGDDWRPGPCNLNDGTSGALAASNPQGGCTRPNTDGSVHFVYDQSDGITEYWTIEGKIASSFDGPLNFLLGANTYRGEGYGDYYVFANSLDVAGAYPGFFANTSTPDEPGVSKGWAVFGEAYYEVSERLKFTLGLRYNEDTRESYSTSVLFNSFDLNGALGGALGQTTFVRVSLADFLFGAPLGGQTALAELYGVDQSAIDAANASAPLSPERLGLATSIPPVPNAGETRYLTNSPTSFKFTEWSGRLGFNWFVTDDSMAYAFYSRGYKPGGLNPAIPVEFQGTSRFSFDPEEINAFEIGTKNRFLDGSMVLNGALYYYDYTGLQVTRIVNNSSINDNIDAEIWGLEAEMFWRPNAVPGLGIDLAYAYTNTKVVDSVSVDPTNRTAGNPDWITLNNTDTGATTGINFVAPVAGLTPAVTAACGAAIPGLTYPDGTPGLWSRNCLEANGVTTSDGLETDLDGNELPNTPKHNIKLGLDYTWEVTRINGAITLRWDYYWQSTSQAREFNVRADKIDSWHQHNASLIYRSSDDRWQVRAFVRNLTDEDNVTGHYLTSDTSGFFRNYFLTEPRIYGASVAYNFGG
jgi:iron complex outermembrane recepter protein